MGRRSQPICQAIYVRSYNRCYCYATRVTHLRSSTSNYLVFLYLAVDRRSPGSTKQMLQRTHFEVVPEQSPTNRLSAQSSTALDFSYFSSIVSLTAV